MSVVPQEDTLQMDFADAQKVFGGQHQSHVASPLGHPSHPTHLSHQVNDDPNDYAPAVQTPTNYVYHPRQSLPTSNSYYSQPLNDYNSPSPDFQTQRQAARTPESYSTAADNFDKPGMATQTSGYRGYEGEQGRRTPGVIPERTPTLEQVRRNPSQQVVLTSLKPQLASDEMEYEDEEYFNPWFSVRRYLRIYFAEFLGTLILVLWGEGTQAQVIAGRQEPSDYLSIAWGWGVGFMLAIYVASGISGAHINPAVTIALAIFRKFSWKKVPGYIFAQLLGGFTAAAVIFGVYYGPLHANGIGYAGVLTTGPAGALPSVAATFFSVFIGACLLMGSIAAFTDVGNNPTTPGFTPLLLGLVMVGIASSFGYQTGFVLNPARDLGPRLLVWAVGGIDSHTLWLADNAYGIWIPTAGTISGALFGIFLYDILIYNGKDSPVNFNWSRKGRKQRKLRRQNGVPANAGSRERDVEYGSNRRAVEEKDGSGRLSGSTYIGDDSARLSKRVV